MMPPLRLVPGGDSRNKQTRLALVLIGGVFAFGCLAFVILQLLLAPRGDGEAARRMTSQTNLKFIAHAMREYAEDHEGRLPNADEWMSQISPYLENPQVLAAPPGSDPALLISYLMNPEASGALLRDVNRVDPPAIIFEGRSAGPAGDPELMMARGGKFTVLYGDLNVRSTEQKPGF